MYFLLMFGFQKRKAGTFRLHCNWPVTLCITRGALKRYIRRWVPHAKGLGKPKDAISGNQTLSGALMANHIGDLTHYGDKTAESGINLCESQIATSIGDDTLWSQMTTTLSEQPLHGRTVHHTVVKQQFTVVSDRLCRSGCL